jgi:hypothetical protein
MSHESLPSHHFKFAFAVVGWVGIADNHDPSFGRPLHTRLFILIQLILFPYAGQSRWFFTPPLLLPWGVPANGMDSASRAIAFALPGISD